MTEMLVQKIDDKLPKLKSDLIEMFLSSAAKINEYGWHQGDYASTDGRICLVEAMHRSKKKDALANYEDDWTPVGSGNRLIDAACKYLKVLIGDYYGLVEFNDEPGRTKEDVIILLEQAVANLKEED